MGTAILIIIAVAFYFIPYLVATARHSDRSAQIFLLNLLLGWSILGWIIALVMAVGKNKK